MDPILTKKKNCPKYEIFISPKVVHLLPFAAARVTSRAQTSMGPSFSGFTVSTCKKEATCEQRQPFPVTI
jgi:hypothetical protein